MLIKNIIFKFYFRHLLLKDIEKNWVVQTRYVNFLPLCAEKQILTQGKGGLRFILKIKITYYLENTLTLLLIRKLK